MKKLPEMVAGRLRSVRLEQNMTLDQVAEAAGTTAGQVHKLEKSMRPLTLEWIERMAAAMKVDPERLISDASSTIPLRKIPIVGRIAAGNWQEAVQEPVEYALVAGATKDAFGLRPIGDSMDLIVPANGFVTIDPHDAELRDGRIYAVMNAEGATTLKRFRADPARLEPCSSNPEHKAIALGREQFSVIGRAISAVQEL